MLAASTSVSAAAQHLWIHRLFGAVVLTNGCAPHVQQALDYVGLSPAFSSIVDTGGIAMIDGKETKVALGARYNKGEYVQRVLMPKHMPTGRAHVIYVVWKTPQVLQLLLNALLLRAG